MLIVSKIFSEAISNALSNMNAEARTAIVNVDVRLRTRLYNVPPSPIFVFLLLQSSHLQAIRVNRNEKPTCSGSERFFTRLQCSNHMILSNFPLKLSRMQKRRSAGGNFKQYIRYANSKNPKQLREKTN